MSETLALASPLPARPRRDLVATLLADPPRAPSTDARVQVAVVWGRDHLLDVRELTEGRAIDLRDGSLATATDATRGLVVRATADGFTLEIPMRTRAIAVDADGRRTLGPGTHALPVTTRVCVESGGVHLVVRTAAARPLHRRALAAVLDLEFLSTFAVLALTAITLERMAQVPVDSTRSLSDEGLRSAAKYAKTIAVKAEPPKPVFTRPAPSGSRAAGEEGRVGRRDAKVPEAARGKAGSVSAKRLADAAKVRAMTSWLTDAGPAADGVFGRGGLGGLNDAMGGVKGAGPHGDSAGVEGLGTRGNGSGGGGDTLRIGAFGPSGDGPGRHGVTIGTGLEKAPFVPPRGERTVAGPGLMADEVDRVVRRHWNEIRYCYEKELQKDPNLGGKVTAAFEIGPFGDVTKSSIDGSTLGSPAAEACVADKVRMWRFPAPRGGGVVQVRYPFLFRSR